MRKAPGIYKLEDLRRYANSGESMARLPDHGGYVIARPIGFWSLRTRLKATWLVWTGRADAVVWPGGQ